MALFRKKSGKPKQGKETPSVAKNVHAEFRGSDGGED